MASLQGLGGANIPPCFSVFKRLQNVVHVPARRGPPSWPRAGAAGTGALEREAFKGMRHSHDALQPRVPHSLFLRPCRPGAPWRRAGELLLCFLFGVPQRFPHCLSDPNNVCPPQSQPLCPHVPVCTTLYSGPFPLPHPDTWLLGLWVLVGLRAPAALLSPRASRP